MKTAICYYSRHHGNTLKVLEAMAEAAEIRSHRCHQPHGRPPAAV